MADMSIVHIFFGHMSTIPKDFCYKTQVQRQSVKCQHVKNQAQSLSMSGAQVTDLTCKGENLLCLKNICYIKKN